MKFGTILCCLFGAALLLPQPALGAVTRPIAVPGRIEAEDYDTGGGEISYHDSDVGNSGGVYRADDVDLEATQDAGGGFNVGWIASGEWLHYTITVQETAVYQVGFRVAARDSAGVIHVSVDGLPLCSVHTPVTGAWQTWQTVTVNNLVLQAGQRLLRVTFQTGDLNLNYIQVTRQGTLSGGFLRASGKQIVDGVGNNVLLRGMGLGNWMLQEPYMMDVGGIVETQQQLKNKIADLVGTNNAAVFYTAWLTNYIGEADVRKLAEAGFNSIRLPMHYGLFTLSIDQEPVAGENTWSETGFKLVDDLLGWCESNHIYLIMDMHGCPGGQGHDKAISDYNPPAPSLWESAANRSKLIALWREIARRYAGKQWIGGYDLINEPNWTFENDSNINGCGDQVNAPLRQLLMDLTASIRQVDTNHILFLMGNCWGGNYNGILPPWDSNLAIGFHKYWDNPAPESFQSWINLRDQWNMPLWLGESGENSNEWFREVVHNAEAFNIGWSWWPWKKVGTIAGTLFVQKPVGYQKILDYWRSGGARPSTNEALSGLVALAQASRFEDCTVHPDVFDALTRPSTLGQTKPFSPHPIPGIIFATDYDLGKQGEAYVDGSVTDPYNSGSVYRNDYVDIQGCSDSAPSNGYNVGWIEAGDWMKYTAHPASLAAYQVLARVAANASGGSFYIDVGGNNVSGIINVGATGGWQSWRTISGGTIPGPRLLTSFRFVAVSPGFNLNWIELRVIPGSQVSFPALTAAVADTNLLLSWPAVATDYRLFSSTSLDSSANWYQANTAVVTNLNQVVATLPFTPEPRFFRLAPADWSGVNR
jgi:endoglucanase